MLLLTSLPLVVLAADPVITITVLPIVSPTVTSSPATGITSTSAILHGAITRTGNENAHTRGFEWGFSTGNYTLSWNETGSFGVGSFFHSVSNFTLGQQVFWRAFAFNNYGEAHSEERSFITSLIPNAPTDFTITQISHNSINITWTKGIGANTTLIRGSAYGYPDISGGYVAYNDTGTWVVVEDLNLSSEVYSYRAWSWNDYGYSDDYAEAQIGGAVMLSLFLGGLALGVSGLFLWKRNIVFAMGAALSWLAIGLLLLLNPEILGLPSISTYWTQMLAYLFFMMAAGCLLWYISGIGKVKLTQTDPKSGVSWTAYGRTPKPTTSSRSSTVKARRREALRAVTRR